MTNKSLTDEYKPISCSFYDLLEASSVQQKKSHIVYKSENELSEAYGIIKKLHIQDGAEYMLLDNGLSIRLDYLISIDSQPANK